MSPQRIKQRFSDFEKALERLREILAEDVAKSSFLIDGTIQRFEFTFELGWKLARATLEYHETDARGPRASIKEAFQEGTIYDGKGWLDMLEARNKTTHIYDQEKAFEIYTKIKESYYSLFEDLKIKVSELIEKMEEE